MDDLNAICQHCGERYHAQRSTSKYCSGACQRAAHRASRKLGAEYGARMTAERKLTPEDEETVKELLAPRIVPKDPRKNAIVQGWPPEEEGDWVGKSFGSAAPA